MIQIHLTNRQALELHNLIDCLDIAKTQNGLSESLRLEMMPKYTPALKELKRELGAKLDEVKAEQEQSAGMEQQQ